MPNVRFFIALLKIKIIATGRAVNNIILLDEKYKNLASKQLNFLLK